jgi:segregation and condensation protein A
MSEKIGQEQFQHFVFNNDFSWKEIIYDLINTEQLDPWDIDLSVLSQKYLEKIRALEEANFVLSSKVLLVASLMLKIKSELLINKYIRNIDNILFNRNKEEVQEEIDFKDYDDEDIPLLFPRTPLPRMKKINLQELIFALNNAIKTETRREIRKRVEREQIEKTKFFIPKKSFSIIQRIESVYSKISSIFKTQDKISFSEFAGTEKESKIQTFVPLLHLDNTNKLWLNQEVHFEEIWIHRDVEKFMQYDDIITNRIESEFEEASKEMVFNDEIEHKEETEFPTELNGEEIKGEEVGANQKS